MLTRLPWKEDSQEEAQWNGEVTIGWESLGIVEGKRAWRVREEASAFEEKGRISVLNPIFHLFQEVSSSLNEKSITCTGTSMRTEHESQSLWNVGALLLFILSSCKNILNIRD